ncbi:MAG: methyltransferase domain-containing protein [Halofilum sp. (in: g-proteobacteria)]|nr:methyltransferase domain-containing protein [Halofilum sp. (in: g-proteobacteria)]
MSSHMRLDGLLPGSVADHPDPLPSRARLDGVRLTYGELTALGRGRGAARGRLASATVIESGFARQCLATVVAIFGALAGAAYVPVDPLAPAARNAYISQDCAGRALVVDEHWLEVDEARLARRWIMFVVDRRGERARTCVSRCWLLPSAKAGHPSNARRSAGKGDDPAGHTVSLPTHPAFAPHITPIPEPVRTRAPATAERRHDPRMRPCRLRPSPASWLVVHLHLADDPYSKGVDDQGTALQWTIAGGTVPDESSVTAANRDATQPGSTGNTHPGDFTLPFPDAAFDRVVLTIRHAWPHAVEQERALGREIGRVLAPGGELLLLARNRHGTRAPYSEPFPHALRRRSGLPGGAPWTGNGSRAGALSSGSSRTPDSTRRSGSGRSVKAVDACAR